MSTVSRAGGPPHSRHGIGALLVTLIGVTGAFGLAACCALPFFLATAGIGTAWLGGIALIAAPHRPLLIAASALCLAGGVVLLWRAYSRSGSAVRPTLRRFTVAGLAIGLVLLYLGYTYV